MINDIYNLIISILITAIIFSNTVAMPTRRLKAVQQNTTSQVQTTIVTM